MDIIHTFLYWFVICLAFALNIALLMGVYHIMRDRHDEGASREDEPHCRIGQTGPFVDEAALRRQAESYVNEAELETAMSSMPKIEHKTSFRMPDMKVESSFGSGKLGKQ